MSPSCGYMPVLQLRLVVFFRCRPNVPDVFRHWPPVGPVFPPCLRLGAGDLLPSMAVISAAAASRLCLPSYNAFVWSNARRTQRVRSAEAKRGAFVSVEKRLLRRTERAERVQNRLSISVEERESSDVIRGSSSSSSSSAAAAGDDCDVYDEVILRSLMILLIIEFHSCSYSL